MLELENHKVGETLRLKLMNIECGEGERMRERVIIEGENMFITSITRYPNDIYIIT